METTKADFEKKGYVLIPDVLSGDEVAFMRRKITDFIGSGKWKESGFNTEKVLSDIYQVFPEFIDIALKPKVIETVKTLLGENPVLMPESAIHLGFYTGWHKDTTTQEQFGHDFHNKPEYLMLEAGFYLQDNDEWGGGLTVMEGSHKTKDNFVDGSHYHTSVLERVKNKLFGEDADHSKKINPNGHKVVDIPSKAGDLVIFNFKTNHRATRPRGRGIDEVPAEKRKIALFNAFSANNETAREYFKYICSRNEPFYDYVRNRTHVNPEQAKHAAQNGYETF